MTFLLTNIHNFRFYYLAISHICIQIFSFSSFLVIHILPIKDCSAGSRSCNFLIVSARNCVKIFTMFYPGYAPSMFSHYNFPHY